MKEKVEALFSDTNVKKYMAFNSAFLLNDYNNDNLGNHLWNRQSIPTWSVGNAA